MERIKMFMKMYHLANFPIMEPFADSSNIRNFKNPLAMDNAIANCNCKI